MRRRLALPDDARLLGVALLAFAVLLVVAPAAPVHHDTVRDLQLARDCATARVCVGAPTSFGGFVQGSGWVRLLALTWLSADAPRVAHVVVLGAHAAACALIHATSRRISASAETWSSLLLFGSLPVVFGFPKLWNPSLLPLGSAVLFHGFVGLTLGRSTPSALLTGIGIAVALEAHPASVVLVPFVVAGTLAVARNPLQVVWVAVVPVTTSTLLSADAWLANFRAALQQHALIPGVVVTVGLAVAATAIRSRLARPMGPSHVRWALAIVALGFAAIMAITSVGLGHGLSARYLAPVAVPACLLAGFGFARALERGGWIPRLVGLGIAGWSSTVVVTGLARFLVPHLLPLDLAQMERLARYFDRKSVSHTRLFWRLRGTDARRLVAGHGLWADQPSIQSVPPGPDWRVLLVPADAPRHPSNWETVPLGSGRTAIVGSIQSWIDTSSIEVCFERIDGGSRSCWTGTSTPPPASNEQLPRFQRLAYPTIPGLYDVYQRARAAGGGRMRITQELELRTQGTTGRRVIEMMTVHLDDDAVWEISRVAGFRHDGRLPSRRVTLRADGSQKGTIEFSLHIDEHEEPELFLAPWLETTASEESIRDGLRRGAWPDGS